MYFYLGDSMSRKRLLSDGHTGKTPAKKFPQLDVKKVAEKHVEKKSRGKPKTPEKRKKLTRRTSAEIKQNTKITEEGKV